ncbi:3-deoxy-D-manno-octulosonic acid transferase [Brackiella oedipodis]|uniref:3-deoxy-D-manno-octulosonic acid transferase n=1 Tax=Brackiella oedipodis TaxID=124225 RepID=UPI00048BF19A|nr:3-deoxy-D-manno-octulosonic acid transferase [Brackiella oedipodis]
MNLFCYNLTLKALSPLLLRWLQSRAKGQKEAWDIYGDQRFGRYPKESLGTYTTAQNNEAQAFVAPVWIHAVSLGETRAAQPLIAALLAQGLPVLLTCMTLTGREQGAKLFASDIARGQLRQAWIPYDLPEAVNGFYDYWQPRCGILIERELWANLILSAKAKHIPMLLVSARFSQRALKQTKRFGKVMRQALASLDMVLAQTYQDERRLRQFDLKHLEVVGNLKFDVDKSPQQVHQGRITGQHIKRPIVVIASTRDGEEALFIKAMQEDALRQRIRQNKTLYVIVPRHPERFAEVEELLQHSYLNFTKRSSQPTDKALMQVDVVLGDSMGEMFFYYGMAEVAIVAGGFVNLGGQNHIEASALGVPVIVGPYTRNFEKAVEDAIVEGAARRAQTPLEALQMAEYLIENQEEADAMSKAAAQWMSLHNGVTQRIIDAIQPYL